jgi:hypothetical protein
VEDKNTTYKMMDKVQNKPNSSVLQEQVFYCLQNALVVNTGLKMLKIHIQESAGNAIIIAFFADFLGYHEKNSTEVIENNTTWRIMTFRF